MQHPTPFHQPHALAPAVRIGLAAAVALVLAGVLGVATSASHTAVRHMSAQMQDTKRYVRLPPVEIVGRRAVATDLREAMPDGARTAAAAAGRDRVQPS